MEDQSVSAYVQEKLLLPLPTDLHTNYQVSDFCKSKLCIALKQFLQALEQTSLSLALSAINQALENLGSVEVLPTSVLSTETPLKQWEVEDYDQYFNVKHVQTKEPADCLVASLLTAYRTWLELNNHGFSLDPAKVEQAKSGFKSYAYLLGRVFNLTLEEMS